MKSSRKRVKEAAWSFSIAWKLAVAATTATVIAVTVAAWLSFSNSRELLLDAAVHSMEESMSRQVERMADALDQVRYDATLATQSEAVEGIIRARANGGFDDSSNMTEEDWKRQLERLFTVMIESKGYQQIRLIGLEDDGREIVRVDGPSKAGAQVRAIRGEKLQAKGSRNYVQQGRLLTRGQTFVSSITLNREHGLVEQPWRPTQRFVAPVLKSVREHDATQSSPLKDLADRIRYLDDALTMSALAASQSGDLSWEQRYRKYEVTLDEVLAKAVAMSATAGTALVEIDAANKALIRLENRAFAFVRNAQTQEAVVLLEGKEYLKHKQEYRKGLDALLKQMEGFSTPFGVIVINTNATKVMDLMEEGGQFASILTNHSGGVLRHPNKDREWKFEFNHTPGFEVDEPDVWQSVLGEGAPVVWETQDQEVHTTGRVPLDDNRFLALVMTAHEEDVLADVAGLRAKIITISLVAIAITCVICVLGVRRLTRPISELTSQANLIAEGGQDIKLSVKGNDEIACLGRAFSNLVEQLQQRTTEATRNAADILKLNESLEHKVQLRTAELANSEAQTRAIVDSAVDVIITIDSRGIVRNFNPAAERTFGHAASEIVGQNVTMIIADSYKQQHEQGLARFVETGEAQILGLTIEVQALRKDGEEFPLELAVEQVGGAEEQLFTAIARDISDRKSAEAERDGHMVALQSANLALEEFNERVEAATQAKSEFLANMSHEIRTPMTAILGFADVVLGNVSDPQNVEGLKTIQRNGKHLLEIINDILDISKIESGKLETEQLNCELALLVSDVASLMKIRADAKGVRFEVEYDGLIPESVQTDPTRLRQILINLIGNAIKFTEVGEIRLVVRLVDENAGTPMMAFDVIDSGIGMSEEQISKLFRPFVQADNSTTRRFGGTGLGLTISKRLATILGGDIHVQSMPGEGSTFSATVNIGSLEGVKMLDSPAAVALPAKDDARPAAEMSPLECRVLLAEDGPDNQRLISFVLKKAGADVTLAVNGQVAYDLALEASNEGTPFDVILMDMQMPVLDGYEATRNLREAGYSGTIIALTAHAMASDKEKCVKAGCDDYTTKPIDRRKLVALVDQYASQKPPAEVSNS